MISVKSLPVVFGMALLPLLGTGWSNPATPTSPKLMPLPTAKADNGWPLYENRAEGFAIALPPKWRQVDLDPQTLEASLKAAGQGNPQLAAMIQGLQQQITAGLKFMGLDPATIATGFATNVNVMKMPIPAGTPRDAIVQSALQEIENLPGVQKPIEHERVKLTAGEAERIRYVWRMEVGPARKVAVTQYVVAVDKASFVVTCTTVPDQADKNSSTFEAIGKEFHTLKK